MALLGSLVRFGKGAGLGAAIGTIAGVLLAPGSGSDTRAALADRIQRTRAAGVDAKANAEQDLINRYRAKVSDQAALTEVEYESKHDHVAALAHIKDTRPTF